MTAKDSLRLENIAALSAAQRDALGALEVTERQAFQGKSFSESIDDWQGARDGTVLGHCFLNGEDPVGLVLFNRPAPGSDAATIHGLKIALPWQGRGWGHAAFCLSVAQLKRDWPEVRTLRLAVDADNHAAIAVYRGYGMEDSGPVFDGKHGPEHHMKLAL